MAVNQEDLLNAQANAQQRINDEENLHRQQEQLAIIANAANLEDPVAPQLPTLGDLVGAIQVAVPAKNQRGSDYKAEVFEKTLRGENQPRTFLRVTTERKTNLPDEVKKPLEIAAQSLNFELGKGGKPGKQSKEYVIEINKVNLAKAETSKTENAVRSNVQLNDAIALKRTLRGLGIASLSSNIKYEQIIAKDACHGKHTMYRLTGATKRLEGAELAKLKAAFPDHILKEKTVKTLFGKDKVEYFLEAKATSYFNSLNRTFFSLASSQIPNALIRKYFPKLNEPMRHWVIKMISEKALQEKLESYNEGNYSAHDRSIIRQLEDPIDMTIATIPVRYKVSITENRITRINEVEEIFDLTSLLTRIQTAKDNGQQSIVCPITRNEMNIDEHLRTLLPAESIPKMVLNQNVGEYVPEVENGQTIKVPLLAKLREILLPTPQAQHQP